MPKIMLDPGHGGKDSGALGGTWQEKDINLEAALAIGKGLAANGFTVGYTRTADVYDGDLVGRGKMARGYDYFLSIHCNAGGGTGAEVYTNCRESDARTELALRERLTPLVGWRKIASRRYDTGEFLTRTADEKTRMFTNGAKSDDWYGVLRGCWSVGVSGDLLELFFIDSQSDRAVFDADRQAVYEAVVRALCEAFGAEYFAPGIGAREDVAGADDRALYEAEKAARITAESETESLRARLAGAAENAKQLVKALEG